MTNPVFNGKALTLKQKVGQLVMAGFNGLEASDDARKLITEDHVGGIIYFRRNLAEPAQVAKLSAELQQIAAESDNVPLLISIDQEGGMVTRLENGVTVVPGNMALGAAGDAELAYEAAHIIGSELRALGINMNFAPSLDINNNPGNPVIGVRSYGGTAELVARLGTEAVRGFQDAGVAATVKHFPGHGDTGEDSHHALPTVPHARERLDRLELAPFREAIARGVDAVMTAHVLFPAVEPEKLPATLSSNVIEGLLRGELGYDGVVVTDCLEMNAISKFYGVGEGAVQAVEAGADLILVSHRYERQKAALDALLAAVESGRISEERIDRSVGRLLALKQRRAVDAGAAVTLSSGDTLVTDEKTELVERISEKSITLLRSEGEFTLDKTKPVLVVWPEVRVGSEVDEVLPRKETLGYWLKSAGYDVNEQTIGVQPTEEEVAHIQELSGQISQVVVVSYNAIFSPDQAALIEALAAKPDVQLIVASARNPFDINALPTVKTFFAAYENTPSAMRALALVLTGQIAVQGTLPAPLTVTV
uniref:GH3 beta-N-acetylglucosaminidase n=2 Tax=Paenibacillaceae TaxID=186822 RepID=A0A5S8WF56_9BACL|nr:GH3 beta-N-acetylglucosaminidase [Paenibacillus sp. FPU-7]